jgi:hypothetical protein
MKKAVLIVLMVGIAAAASFIALLDRYSPRYDAE